MVALVAQTSDWAQQEEDSTVTIDEEDVDETQAVVSDWEGEGEAEAEGEGGEEAYVEPPEEAKIFVGNLPYDVDSQKLAMLFEKAGVVEISEVNFDWFQGFGRF